MLQGDIELYKNHVNEMKENLLFDEQQKKCKGEETCARMNWQVILLNNIRYKKSMDRSKYISEKLPK